MNKPAEHAADAADTSFLQTIDIRQADIQALGQVLLFDIIQVYAFDDGLFLFRKPFQDVSYLFQPGPDSPDPVNRVALGMFQYSPLLSA